MPRFISALRFFKLARADNGAQLFWRWCSWSSQWTSLPNMCKGEGHDSSMRALSWGCHRAGKVRAIAVATPKRTSAMPDLATVSEAGLAGYKFDAWFGLM